MTVHKDKEGRWSEIRNKAVSKLRNLRTLICKAPVLCYFDPPMEITIQYDDSNRGLGCVLLQQGLVVACGASEFTLIEKDAQIKK